MSLYNLSLYSCKNGGLPVNISYIKHPNDHQSVACPKPFPYSISGDIYSAVPQIICEPGSFWTVFLSK